MFLQGWFSQQPTSIPRGVINTTKNRALVPAVLAARPDGLGRRRSAWSLPLRLVRPPGLGHRLFQRPGARAGCRA